MREIEKYPALTTREKVMGTIVILCIAALTCLDSLVDLIFSI
jgi:hypothetical protein